MKPEIPNTLPDGSPVTRRPCPLPVGPESQPMSQDAHCITEGSHRERPKQGQALDAFQIAELEQRNARLEQRVELLRRALGRAYRFAFRDPLTGLPNRRVLEDHFDQAVSRAAREQHMVALLFIDLDRFKRINDVLGHAVGDQLLCQVAGRLASCTRKSDTACRYGGDEFLVLIPDCEDREDVEASAQKIRGWLEEDYRLDGAVIELTVSIGMALYPLDGEDYDVLMHRSDRAMYVNKAQSHPKRLIT